MPEDPFAPPAPPIPFVGRKNELEWLRREVTDRGRQVEYGKPIVVAGPAGIGKTSLVAQFLVPGPPVSGTLYMSSPGDPPPAPSAPIWIPAVEFLSRVRDFGPEIDHRTLDRRQPLPIVILDGIDALKDRRQREVLAHVFNYKLVRAVIITSREQIEADGQRTLRLDRLEDRDAESLLFDASGRSIGDDAVTRILSIGDGSPLVLSLLAKMANSLSERELRQALAGHLYDLNQAAVPKGQLIAAARPTIITSSEAMMQAHKKEPDGIHALAPRQFEELVAELLRDMGWDVQLTPATRDGGKDILAYLDTDIGKLLCLVEAKRYSKSRKIGVELVRTLYGTLCDYQANSAMMVTTSSFSKDARMFQKKHEMLLRLRDYTDVVGWIMKHGRNSGS
jgi:restriction system protein